MNDFTFRANSISLPLIGSLLLTFFLTGCGKQEPTAYRVPKETTEPAMAAEHSHGNMMGDAVPAPKVQYKKPEGWQEMPVQGNMRAAQFAITNASGQEAEVAIIAMPGASATSMDIIGMYRDQLGLDKSTNSAASPVEIGPNQGQLYDLVSTEPLIDNKFKARIMSALLKQDQAVWIIKIAGEDELVRQQKTAFLAFLKSIQFSAPAEPTPTTAAPKATAASAPTSQKPSWDPPATWKEEPPSQMLLAKFITGKDNAQAEITISSFPGDVGGLLANVNRWRGQVGLGQIEQADLSKQTTSVDVLGGRATLVDITGQKGRLVGAIVPRGDQTWFYKMMGPDPVVAAEKEAFLKFVQSVKYAQ
jgi:hypothetical protein